MKAAIVMTELITLEEYRSNFSFQQCGIDS